MAHISTSGQGKYKKKKRELSYFLEGIARGNTFILSEAITLAESTLEEDKASAQQVLLALKTKSKDSLRIAVTGSPGAGKSTFIDYLGMYWIAKGDRVAVLTIDPSSMMSEGSILGDKTRMEILSTQENAFVRPSASGHQLGGISSRTKEAILLCEVAGFDKIIIETVGVGQNEAEASAITDVNLFVLQPGAGDDLQGIKRGVLEKVDICIVNKADGALSVPADETARHYRQSLHYFHHVLKDWMIPVHKVSSLQKEGLEDVIKSLDSFVQKSKSTGYFYANRQNQEIQWFEKQAYESVLSWARQFHPLQTWIRSTEKKIRNGEINALEGVQKIVSWMETVKT